METDFFREAQNRVLYSQRPKKRTPVRSHDPGLLSEMKAFHFLTLPATNGIAGTEMSHGFISFGLILLKVFNHFLEFRV